MTAYVHYLILDPVILVCSSFNRGCAVIMPHIGMLQRGVHHSSMLQAAWDARGEGEGERIRCQSVLKLERGRREGIMAFIRRVRASEQDALDLLRDDPRLGNCNKVAIGPRKKWPVRRRAKRRKKAGLDARLKYARCKTGARNPRGVVVFASIAGGRVLQFSNASVAARFAGVTQQAMDQWLKGKFLQPSESRKPSRRRLWYVHFSLDGALSPPGGWRGHVDNVVDRWLFDDESVDRLILEAEEAPVRRWARKVAASRRMKGITGKDDL